MKMIMRRALCLILVLALVTPVAASAATPLYTYPSVQLELSDGITTNKMAYVDQFYNATGGFSAKGRALLKWLDMGEREEGIDRTNSGYLMLEQEIKHQVSNGKYISADIYIKTARVILETVGSFGANGAAALVKEAKFREKFPNAGSSAYIYYTYLTQIYLDYVSNLNAGLQETDNALSTLADLVSDVSEWTTDSGKVEWIEYMGGNSSCITPENYSGTIKSFTVTDIHYTKTTVDGLDSFDDIVFSVVSKEGRESGRTFKDLIRNIEDGHGVVLNLNADLVDKLNTNKVNVKELLTQSFVDTFASNSYRRVKMEDLEMTFLLAAFDGMTDTEAFTKLAPEMQQFLLESRAVIKQEKAKLIVPEKLFKTAEIAEKAASVIGAAADVYGYVLQRNNVKAKQVLYLNKVQSNTQDFLYTLQDWRVSLEASSLPSGEKEAIYDAIQAVALDYLELHNATAEAIAADTAGILTAEKLAETILNVADAALSLAGTEGILQQMMAGGTKNIATIAAVNAIGSCVLNAVTNQFVEFGDSSSAIYYMKWSLYDLLAGNNGLLYQYSANRNHQTACEIIDAMKMMKSAKYMGENLVEQYYLFDFYEDQGIEDWSSNAHMVLWNEMMHWDGYTSLNILPSITPVVAVCEDTWSYVSKGDVSYAGDMITEYTDVSTEVLGYYLLNGSRTASYLGVELEPLTSVLTAAPQYSKLPNGQPVVTGFSFQKETTISQEWLNGGVPTGSNPDMMYKVPNLRLYSNYGVDVILSADEYVQCLELQNTINNLFKKYNDPNQKIYFFNWNEKDEQQTVCRIEWTILTRKWIESQEMYDSAVDYTK